MEAFLQSFTDCRMRVDVSSKLGGGEVPQLCQRQLGEDLTHFAAHPMRSQKLAMLLVGNQLDETAAFTQSVAFALACMGKVATRTR